MGNMEALGHHTDEDTETSQQKEDSEPEVTGKDLDDMKSGNLNTAEVAFRAKKRAEEAEALLNKLATDKDKVLTPEDNREFLERIREIEKNPSLDAAEKLYTDIEKYKEKTLNKKDRENLERDWGSPEIKRYRDEVDKLFSKTHNPEMEKYLGRNQVASFKEFCLTRMRKKPTIANAKETLRLVQEHETNGIAPRKRCYEAKIKPLLSKYGIPLNSAPLLRDEGLSEREAAIKKMKEGITLLEQGQEKGLWSFDVKQKTIASLLKSSKQGSLVGEVEKLKEVSGEESKGFVSMNSSVFTNETVWVHGKRIRAMSDASIKAFLRDYKEYSVEKRKATVENWGKIAKNEGKLVQELGEIYEKDPEGFNSALRSFEVLEYTQKEKALKTHKRLVEKNEKETLRKSLEILRTSIGEIEKAREKKDICPRTAKRFRDAAQDTSRYTDTKTGRIDLKKQQAMHDELTANTPVFESEKRNLRAYAVKRKAFKDLLARFAKNNPHITPEELKEREQKYNSEAYEKRMIIHKKLEEETKKKETEAKKRKAKKQDPEQESEQAENPFKRENLIKTVEVLIEERTKESINKGLIAVNSYITTLLIISPDARDKKVEGLRAKLEKLRDELGSLNAANDDEEITQKQEEAEKIISEDTETKRELEELEKTREAEELIKKSEEIHGDEDARKRSQKAAEERAEVEGEEKVIERFYEDDDKESALDRDKTGTKIKKTELGDKMSWEDLEAFKGRLDAEKAQNTQDKKGTTVIEFTKHGRRLDGKERESTQKEREEKVAARIKQKLNERQKRKEGIEPNSEVYNISERIKNERAAKNAVENKVKKAA